MESVSSSMLVTSRDAVVLERLRRSQNRPASFLELGGAFGGDLGGARFDQPTAEFVLSAK